MKSGKQRVSLLILLCLMVVGLAGCRNKDYSRSIENGLNAVAENKYQKALTYFDNALTQKPKDEKAQAYRDQTQAYLTTTAKLKSGEVKTALATVDKGVEIANGATSLTNKLKQLKVTVTSDYQEYQQLSDDVKAQLKVKNGNYSASVLKRCAAINWDKKPYLKSLKPKVKQLLTAAKKAKTKMKVSAAEAKRAAALRQKIAAAKNKWDMDALDDVPDWFILALFADDSDVDDAAETLDDEYDSQADDNDDDSDRDDQTADSNDDTNDNSTDADDDWDDQDTDSTDDYDDDSDTNSDADSDSDYSEDDDDEDSNSDYDDDSESQSDDDYDDDTDSESDDDYDDSDDYDTDDQYDDDDDYDDAESLLNPASVQPSVADRLFASVSC
ncbi:outer membrane protein assembly factor BamD [Lactiplantibacillus paraplantarum]|uniref:Extracellular lipoprotein, Asp-rich n=1 Tax=Lactiplantibacillus paraplantarum TaxID=60520 RepID=A0AAD0X758_9LACO|nr:hypothetical protein [Lactiplantibacillus paraplantarum]AVW09804.1 hypothetical protein DA077_04255 [Lactiplantibacillus paraplantarum]AYJ38015.1 hypothetical protein LP667_03855 [Lactiplantibacillus paraplantarum]ERL45469.1 lipoprotein precursor [Lactiplantibacillus paraplantarum]KRL46497.1 extracellular lipoprotein precursor, asp-rich [Lactiplantibacillus paraplantarum DSM 10667]MDL2061804.1 hypothetical protein [Lactiplantibacillus paraplantarum]